MNKLYFIVFIFILGYLPNQTKAQSHKLEINLGPESLIPIGETAGTNNLSYAGSLQVIYHFKPKFDFTLTGAYAVTKPAKLYKDLWEPWDYTFKDGVFFPVKAGLKYNWKENLYFQADAGASLAKDSTRTTSFAYSIGLGTYIPLGEKSKLQLSAKYENWLLDIDSYSHFIGIRAAFAIPLLKK